MSARQRLPRDFGIFTKQNPQEIQFIKDGARALVSAFETSNKIAWDLIIDSANAKLTKHQRGMFSAFALSILEEGK